MKNSSDSPAKKKLIAQIKKRYPSISDEEMPAILSSVKRFVKVAQKIITEPQAHIKYTEQKIDGKIIKNRVIETDIFELQKLAKKNNHSLGKSILDLSETYKQNEK